MNPGDSSKSAESKTAPAAAAAAAAVDASNPSSTTYQCKNCSNQFETSHALCIHQETHRMASEKRTKPNGVINVPSDERDEVDGPASDKPEPVAMAEPEPVAVAEPEPEPVAEAEAAPEKGTGSGQSAKGKEPAVTVTKPNDEAPPAKPKAITNTASGSNQTGAPIMKAPVPGNPDQQERTKRQRLQPILVEEVEPKRQQPQTKDLLREWNPMFTIEETGSSWELLAPDVAAAAAAARALYRRGDDLELDLKLDSMNHKNVDLDLKLGH